MNARPQRLAWLALLAIAGFGYFGQMSGLDAPMLLKPWLTLLPMQGAVLLYFVYRHWQQRQT
ncbi:hypothetical protein [Geitlerinema sp. PCC 7407]|uniref:hypothetical protein n=1 Tax=Geitlerinema sp. PCC 7407 TaxID=1173025 RepID=UPI00029FAFBD|nr:hypothetical protein [Geitlerinema sp. PCC 7407]AFY67217.1 hypothetical protein GEI7407_2744 [Geitlerinema sp. PCC 7407]